MKEKQKLNCALSFQNYRAPPAFASEVLNRFAFYSFSDRPMR